MLTTEEIIERNNRVKNFLINLLMLKFTVI